MPRYIDADALFKTVNRKFYSAFEVGSKDSENGRFRRGYNVAITDACEAITAAPTISPDEARGVGEWIEKEVYNLEDTTIEQMQSARCSSCGKYHTTPFSYYFSKYNYCPNCGAMLRNGGTDDS